MIKKVLFPIIVLALILAACAPSAAQAKTTFCTSLQGLQQAVTNLKSIDKNTTVDQARQYVNAYEAAWQNVLKANQNLKAAQFSELQASHNNLDKTLKSIDGQTTLDAAIPQIQAAYGDYINQIQTIGNVNCK